MCEFKAEELLKLRRMMAQGSDKVYDLVASTKIIAAIDDLRYEHEKKTGCQCWYAAVGKVAA